MVVYHVGMSNNTDDFVGFCPHENLTGGNSASGDSIMIGGPVKLRFAGKRHTVLQAKVLSTRDIVCEEPKAEEPVAEEETGVTGIIPGPDDTPVVEEETAVDAPVAEDPQEEPKPAKKARKTKKKA